MSSDTHIHISMFICSAFNGHMNISYYDADLKITEAALVQSLDI